MNMNINFEEDFDRLLRISSDEATDDWYDTSIYDSSSDDVLFYESDDSFVPNYCGQKFFKKFEKTEFSKEGWYQGKVVSYLYPYYRIYYCDGDQEDMTKDEVEYFLIYYPSKGEVENFLIDYPSRS